MTPSRMTPSRMTPSQPDIARPSLPPFPVARFERLRQVAARIEVLSAPERGPGATPARPVTGEQSPTHSTHRAAC